MDGITQTHIPEDADDPILTEFPFYVIEFPRLRELSISFHYLTEIPDEIGMLTELRTLCCSNNRYG